MERRSVPYALASCLLLVLASGRGEAGTITSSVITQNRDEFDIRFIHADANGDHTTNLGPLGTEWQITLTVVEDSDANDELDISGTVRHILAPHGEGLGPLINFTFPHINAGSFAGGFQTVNAMNVPLPMGHGEHRDVITTAFARFNVDAGILFNDITTFEVRIAVHHTPEPSSLLMLGTGLAGLAGMAWKRRHRPRDRPACP